MYSLVLFNCYTRAKEDYLAIRVPRLDRHFNGLEVVYSSRTEIAAGTS